MGKNRASRRSYSQMVVGIAVVVSLVFGVCAAEAASFLNSCTTYCHGTPLRDGARKGNPHFGSMSSAFIGNHKNHLSAAPSTNDCSICHTPVTATSFGHQNNIIDMAVKLKGYSTSTGRARYDKGVFFNMTSIPNLTNATCSNVNCHFEKKTPLWGSSAAATTCETCHGALISPLTLAHPKHIIGLGNTISTCTSCHNNYTGAAAYTHATSAGRAIKVTVGAYAGSNNRYLPSQTTGRATGTCSTVACHGSATLMPWSGTLWSTTDQCAKCHSSNTAGAITQAVPFYGTAYPTKVTLNTNAKVGAHTNHMTSQALGISASTTCTDCHGTVTLASATHMTGATNLVWSALATRSGALVPAYTAATGACANTYCHGASMPGGDTSGTNRAPTWINPNYLPATISTAACGLCHGFPPAAASGHPGGITIPAGFPATATIGTTCSCHSNINTAGNSYANIFINPALHINGIFEPAASGHVFPYGGSIHLSAAATTPWTNCTGCHANTAGGAYPVAAGAAPNCTGCHIQGLKAPSGTSSCWDCHGASAIDGKPSGNLFPNISGNHRIHVAITGTTCATCHTGGGSGTAAHGPSNRVAATTATVKVAFTGQGAAPLWTLATKTCSATNCHGQGAPAWGARVGAVVNGFPYSSAQCAKCHSGNLAADVTAAKPFYSTAIPQVTLNTNAKVGAHTSHLTAPDSLTNAFACADCHGTVTLTSATHMNGTTNLIWSTLATKSGALVPTFTAATGVCANVYCHGASMPGGDTTGTNRAPTWTSATYLPATIGAGGTACKTCHGFPPLPASGHPALTAAVPATFGNGTVAIGASCSCHANISATGTTYANIFVNKALHINGTVDVSGGHAVPFYAHATPPFTSCTGCHNASAAGTYPAAVAGTAPNCRGCHVTADPTVTTTGCASCHASPPSGTVHPNIVGSHVKHSAVACATCHNGAGAGSGASHGPGNKGTNPAVDNVIFTAAQAGASATWTAATKTCSTTYCHGATLTGGTSKSPVWGTTLTGCGLCHGDPPATTTHSGVTVTQCITCHDHVNAAGTGFTNAALHMNGVIDASGGTCIGCHASVQVGTHGTPRDAVMSEFGLAWGHKKSGRGAVTDADCIVCHLEGDFATQKPSAKHQDGNIDLRDPDGVGEAAITNISGTAFTFTKFATSYAAGSRTSTGHLSNTDIANVITQKFCLACHDSNGATNTTARSNNGGTGTAAMPLGGKALGATYTAANNAVGTQGLIDVKTQFALTNSSRHPVLGPRTRDFPYSTRLAVPYNNIGTARDANGTTGHTTAASVVINCFDCHNTPTTPLTTRTVAAHGNAVTLRGTVYAGSVASTLCTTCHTGYTVSGTHSTGSAWSATGSSHNVSRGCEYCHGSQTSTTAQVRPIRAQDYHGSNARVGGGLWPTVNSRPYAFIRGWSGTAYHRPYRATEFTTGSATCGAGTCPGGGQVGDGSTRSYTAGGTY